MGKSNRAAAQRRKPYRGDPSQLPAIQVDSDAIEETCDEVKLCTICGRKIKEGQETYRHLCQHKKCGERSRSVEYTIKQQGPKAVKKWKKLKKTNPLKFTETMKKMIRGGGKGGRLNGKLKAQLFSSLDKLSRNKRNQRAEGHWLFDQADYVNHFVVVKKSMNEKTALANFELDLKNKKIYKEKLKVRIGKKEKKRWHVAVPKPVELANIDEVVQTNQKTGKSGVITAKSLRNMSKGLCPGSGGDSGSKKGKLLSLKNQSDSGDGSGSGGSDESGSGDGSGSGSDQSGSGDGSGSGSSDESGSGDGSNCSDESGSGDGSGSGSDSADDSESEVPVPAPKKKSGLQPQKSGLPNAGNRNISLLFII